MDKELQPLGKFYKHIEENANWSWERNPRVWPPDILDIESVKEMIDEAKQKFPFERCSNWNSITEELEFWRKISLSKLFPSIISWIQQRIKTLEWFVEYFGQAKE